MKTLAQRESCHPELMAWLVTRDYLRQSLRDRFVYRSDCNSSRGGRKGSLHLLRCFTSHRLLLFIRVEETRSHTVNTLQEPSRAPVHQTLKGQTDDPLPQGGLSKKSLKQGPYQSLKGVQLSPSLGRPL